MPKSKNYSTFYKRDKRKLYYLKMTLKRKIIMIHQ